MRHNQHIKTGLAVTFVLAAITAPAASAQAGWVVRPNPDEQAAQFARAAATRPVQSTWVVRPNPDEQYPAPAPVAIVRVTDPNGGFDWGAAGIGATGTLGLILAAHSCSPAVGTTRPQPARGRPTDTATTWPACKPKHDSARSSDRAQSLTPTVPMTGTQRGRSSSGEGLRWTGTQVAERPSTSSDRPACSSACRRVVAVPYPSSRPSPA